MGLNELFNWLERHITNINYGLASLLAASGALSLQEWAFVTGIVVAIITCLVNWYYRRKAVLLLKTNLIINRKVYEKINR